MELSGVTGSSPHSEYITNSDCAAILLLSTNLLGLHLSFSHPDYTVGSGIAPDQPSATGRQVTDFATVLDRYPHTGASPPVGNRTLP